MKHREEGMESLYIDKTVVSRVPREEESLHVSYVER